MRHHLGIIVVLGVIVLGVSFVGYRAWRDHNMSPTESGPDSEAAAVAVEVAPIDSGVLREVRTLSGTLEAKARLTVAAKVGGLVESVVVDIGDEVERREMVAEIDDAEFVQAVAQAEAESAVRRAEQSRAESDRSLAQRDYDRAQALKERGIASESELDETSAALQSAEAALELAKARVQQADASLELAKIRLGYTDVRASWTDGPGTGTVSRRYQEPGNTIQAGDPIVSIAALDPLTAVVSVTEGDYARLRIGQSAVLTTEARPGETFKAEVARIAPVFQESSRQARVELRVDNPERALRPGTFIRVRIVLRETKAHTIVPSSAVIERSGRPVLFTVHEDSQSATMHPVETGIEQGDRIEIRNPDLSGRVIVLGQELLEDGAAITIAEQEAKPNMPERAANTAEGEG